MKEQAGAEHRGSATQTPAMCLPGHGAASESRCANTEHTATATCTLWPQPSHCAKRRARKCAEPRHGDRETGGGPTPSMNSTGKETKRDL